MERAHITLAGARLEKAGEVIPWERLVRRGPSTFARISPTQRRRAPIGLADGSIRADRIAKRLIQRRLRRLWAHNELRLAIAARHAGGSVTLTRDGVEVHHPDGRCEQYAWAEAPIKMGFGGRCTIRTGVGSIVIPAQLMELARPGSHTRRLTADVRYMLVLGLPAMVLATGLAFYAGLPRPLLVPAMYVGLFLIICAFRWWEVRQLAGPERLTQRATSENPSAP